MPTARDVRGITLGGKLWRTNAMHGLCRNRNLLWVAGVLSLLIGAKSVHAQLMLNSTTGPLTANGLFQGIVNYDLSSVGGAGNSGSYSGYDFAVAQTGSSTASMNFIYPPSGVYDFTTATGFGTGGFRTTFLYTNNTGSAVPGLRFDLTQDQPAFFTNLNGIPSRGTLTNPSGPSPGFTGVTSNQVPNGDTLIHNGNSFLVDTIYDWSFATPLNNGGTYAFFLPIEVPVTSPGGQPPGAFTLAITPVPEPTSLMSCAFGAVLGLVRSRHTATWRAFP